MSHLCTVMKLQSAQPVLHILYLRNNSRCDKEDYDFNHKIRRDHHNFERCLTAKGRPVKSRSERNLNPDLCKTSAVRYHRSYTVNWELAVTWVYDNTWKVEISGARITAMMTSTACYIPEFKYYIHFMYFTPVWFLCNKSFVALAWF